MKFAPFSFALGALALSSLAAQAQFGSQPTSHGYTTVDPYGNRTTTVVQTPLAGASNAAGLIAGQGVLGSRTTTTLSYGSSYGSPYGSPYGYPAPNPCPPTYPYANAYPGAYGYPNAYPYGGVNNYYYPAQPYSFPVTPRIYDWSHPAVITGFPTVPTYGNYAAPPLYPSYPYPAPYPTTPYAGYGYPGYTTTYTFGTGYGSIQNRSTSSGYGISIGHGGISGNFGNHSSRSTTTVTGH